MQLPRALAALLVLLAAVAFRPAEAAGPRAADLVRAGLLVEPDTIRPGEPFTVGLRLETRAGWHTYWRNPGDSGLPTEIAWRLPPGFSAGPIEWPVPDRIEVGGIVNYGYEESPTLLVRITPPATLQAGAPVDLAADVTFLVCERECIPGDATVSGRAEVAGPGDVARVTDEAREIFDAARAKLPQPEGWPVSASADGDRVRLEVGGTGLAAGSVKAGYFFPYSDTAIDHAAPQAVTLSDGTLRIDLARSPQATGATGPLGGVLVLDGSGGGDAPRRAVAVGPEPVAAPAAADAPVAAVPARRPAAPVTLAEVGWAALFAFLGGLVLNLMPCVFPVLSIKVMALVSHSGLSRGLVRLNGLAYAAGVVASFLVLAGALLAVRAGGAELGWGFQLQSPGLVAGLAFLLFAMGLSLSGAVEFGASLGRFGALGSGTGLPSSFGTGVLATVVATPCTAPFMGTALGYALVAPAAVALGIFAALGLGMAAPFLVLTIWPGLAARLPRPGAWMATLKGLLAFPIYATVAWLVFVASQQVGPDGLAAIFAGLVLVGFAVWALRQAGERGPVGRRLALVSAVVALLGLVGLGATLDGSGRAAGPEVAASGQDIEPFTQARLDALRAEGRPVFVNMTAAWCLSCLVNERTSLSTDGVRAAFRARDVAYLKGDWTNQNPEITRLLEENGRSGVPLYLLYSGRGEPAVLPQILTPSTVLDALAHLDPPRAKRASLPPTSQDR